MLANLDYAIKDVDDAFRLLEFSIRILNYFELDKVTMESFGCGSVIKLKQENISFNDS